MSGSVIQDFLVSIAYQEGNRQQFQAGLEEATKKAAVLGVVLDKLADAAINTASKIASAVMGMVSQLDALYFASQRTGMGVASMQALGFAVSQLGGTVEGARASFEGLGRFLRTNPAGESFIQSLGVRTRETNGQLRDMGAVFSDLGSKLKDMPQFQALQVGGMLGLDERTILAMIAGVDQFSKTYRNMLNSAGIDSQKAAKDANYFSTEVRTLGAGFQVLQEKVASLLTRAMGNDIRRFREMMTANFDGIGRAIAWVSGKFLAVAEGVAQLALRAVQAAQDIGTWWGNLSQSSRSLIEAFGAVLLAWRLLNTGFLATPLGAVVALGLALGSLYDDYKTWKEGGQSLINWGDWEPQLASAWKGITDLGAALARLGGVIKDELLAAFHLLLDYAPDELKKFLGQTLTEVVDNAIRGLERLTKTLTDIIRLVAAVARGDWAGAAAAGAAIMGDVGKEGADASKGNDELSDNMVGRTARYARNLFGHGDEREDGTPATRFLSRLFGGMGGGAAGIGKGVQHPEAGLPVSRVEAAMSAFTFWKSKGYTDQGAAAMTGQEQGESEGDPAARGDHGNSHGLYQWDATRRAAILAKTGINVSTASAAKQREAAYLEGKLGLDAGAARAMAVVQNTRSLEEGVASGVHDFERSADQPGDIRKRTALGRDVLRRFGGGPRADLPTGVEAMERARGLAPGTLSDLERAAGAPGVGLQDMGAAQPLGAGSNDNSTTHAPTLNQTTTITVNGGGPDVGRQVMDGQRTTNQEAIRALSTKAR